MTSIVGAPEARGLFRRVIIQSGSGTAAFTPERAEIVTAAVGRGIGVAPTAAALGQRSDEELVDVLPRLSGLDLATVDARDPLGGITPFSLLLDRQPADTIADLGSRAAADSGAPAMELLMIDAVRMQPACRLAEHAEDVCYLANRGTLEGNVPAAPHDGHALPNDRWHLTNSYAPGMRSDETLYYLEIRSPAHIQPVHPLPDGMILVEQRNPGLIHDLTLAIGQPYRWPSQDWDDRHWAGYLRQEDLRHWTAELGKEVLGLASLKLGHDEVELDTFGLVPGQVGKGLGGAFLTRIARLAWQETPSARRLWLHTSSSDHPHVLGNYLRRGYHLYKTLGPPGP